MLADFPPTNTSVWMGRLPAVGATLSAKFTGPKPVPYSVTTWPGAAVMAGAFNGCWLCETKLKKIPGPIPARTANIPRLLLTILTGPMLLLALLKVTCTDAIPSATFDGMMALICEGPTNIG